MVFTEEPQFRRGGRSSNCQYSLKITQNCLSLQFVLSVDPKVFQLFLPNPFGDVPCASNVSKIQLLVCSLGIRNALLILNEKHRLHVMWHWIWKMKQQLLPPPPLLKRAWSFLRDRGRNSLLAMNGADVQEYFACIITMLSFQRRKVLFLSFLS